MENYFINSEFIVINEHDSRFYVVRKTPFQQFDINQDSYKILEIIQENQGLPPQEEPLAEHIIAFLNQLRDFGILTNDPERKATANVKKIMTKPGFKRIFCEITCKCNLKCRHCYNSSDIDSLNENQMSTDEVKMLIDQANEMGVWQFDLTGGEVFLRDDIFEILEYAKLKGMATVIFSNATLLDEEKIIKLKELQIRKLVVSVDGYTSKVHDEFRGVEGALEKTIENIKLMKKHGVDVDINVMLGDHNANEINQLVDYLRFELKVPFAGDVIMPIGRGSDITNSENYACILGYINQLNGKETACSIENMGEFEVPPQRSCGIGDSFLYVTHEGSFNLCPSLTYKFDEAFRFGNIRKDKLYDVWTSGMDKFRNLNCEKHAECQAHEKCKGGCRSRAYSAYGSIYSADKVYCKIYGCE